MMPLPSAMTPSFVAPSFVAPSAFVASHEAPLPAPLSETLTLSGEELDRELEQTVDTVEVEGAPSSTTRQYERQDEEAEDDDQRQTVESGLSPARRPSVTLPFRRSAQRTPVSEGRSVARTVIGVLADLAPPLPFVAASEPESVPHAFGAEPNASEEELSVTVEGSPIVDALLPFDRSIESAPPNASAPTQLLEADDASIRILGLTTGEYASMTATLRSPHEPRHDAPRPHGMTQLRWRFVEQHWSRSLEECPPDVVDSIVAELQRAVRRALEDGDTPPDSTLDQLLK
jgi:hypothetical protein